MRPYLILIFSPWIHPPLATGHQLSLSPICYFLISCEAPLRAPGLRSFSEADSAVIKNNSMILRLCYRGDAEFAEIFFLGIRTFNLL